MFTHNIRLFLELFLTVKYTWVEKQKAKCSQVVLKQRNEAVFVPICFDIASLKTLVFFAFLFFSPALFLLGLLWHVSSYASNIFRFPDFWCVTVSLTLVFVLLLIFYPSCKHDLTYSMISPWWVLCDSLSSQSCFTCLLLSILCFGLSV